MRFSKRSAQTVRKRSAAPKRPSTYPLRINGTVRAPIVTTSLMRQAIVAVAIISVAVYIVWQVLLLAGNPQLHVEFPSEDQIVYSNEVEIVGSTTPGSEVRIDGQQVLVADDGSFRIEIVLAEGVYEFELEARSSLGRTTRLERTVIVQSPSD